jgi:hypothetical protein
VDAVETVHRPDELVAGRGAREIRVGDEGRAHGNADRHSVEQGRHEADSVRREEACEVAPIDPSARDEGGARASVPVSGEDRVIAVHEVDHGLQRPRPSLRRRSGRKEPIGDSQDLVGAAHGALPPDVRYLDGTVALWRFPARQCAL